MEQSHKISTSNAHTEKQPIKYHEQPGNLGAQKENEKSPGIKLKGMEDCGLNDREFKTAITKKLNNIQENSEKQVNKFRNTINEQKKKMSTLPKRFKL